MEIQTIDAKRAVELDRHTKDFAFTGPVDLSLNRHPCKARRVLPVLTGGHEIGHSDRSRFSTAKPSGSLVGDTYPRHPFWPRRRALRHCVVSLRVGAPGAGQLLQE